MTPLDKSLKRALKINGHDYVVTLAPDALKITQKGHRLGVELKWADLVSGQSALAVALNASIGKFQDGVPALPRKPNDIARRASAKSPHRSTAAASPHRSTAASPRRAATASAHRATRKHAPPKRLHPR
jgi:hypothetical protein